MKTGRRQYDVAYGCFLVWALTLLSLEVITASYTDAEWAGGAGGIILLLLPLILASFVAMLVGIALSMRLRRHWPLMALSVSSVLLVTEVLTEFGSTAFQRAAPIVYGVGVVAMSGLWFLGLRRRHFPAALPSLKE